MVGFKGSNATVVVVASLFLLLFVCDDGGDCVFANLLYGFLFLCVYVCTRTLFAFANVLQGIYLNVLSFFFWGGGSVMESNSMELV